MIEINGLSVKGKGGVDLLQKVDFSISPGCCTGLTGPSGAGKTTIIKAIMGMLDWTCSIVAGEVRLDGEDLSLLSPRQRRNLCGTVLGFIPQNPMTAFNPHMRIGKIMEETFCVRLKCSKSEASELAAKTLKRMNLEDTDRILSSYSTQLSGGMLQRITMAILWAMKPKYILADEPTSALDEGNRNLLIRLFQEYPESCGILFLSHDTAALRMLCEKILVLECGRIVEEAETDILFQNPKSSWTKQFVSVSKESGGGDWQWSVL